ncbi:MAG: ABC transporter ATP-binding protein [Geminicoccaceae bacterium]
MSDLTLRGVRKTYGAITAVDGIDLHIPEGEFTVLVGPSGCGKSTLLRAIAGLETIQAGDILIGGERVNDRRPRDRDLAMVFQSYALYPFLTVEQNIAFGLRARKTPEAEINSRVSRVAEMLHITPLLNRRPRELSGGQRQRVAIGRAIVRDARLYLFDEPLSNLDAKLRDGMREEIKRLHKELGRTFIYVTHDQIEAMTLAERIVLLRDGRIEQEGAPLDLFERPRTRFVAGFLGSPAINLLPVTREGDRIVLPDGQRLSLTLPQTEALAHHDGALLWAVRPEQVTLAGAGGLRLPVTLVQPTGPRLYASLRVADHQLTAEFDAASMDRLEGAVQVDFAMARTLLIDPVSERTLYPPVDQAVRG